MTLVDAGLRLATPTLLLAFALFAAALALALLRARRTRGGVLFPSVRLLPAARGRSLRLRLRWVLVPLRVLAATLVVVALVRPQVGQAAYEQVAQGIDIVLALDTSSSMSTQDFAGRSRMDVAKSVLRSFVGGLEDHRVGMVIFSGEALVLSPLTLDRTAVQRLIEPIEAGKPLRDGTAIGTGIATAVNVLRDSGTPSRVIVLLTDGEQNAGQITPLDAANIARLLGIRVYTIGAVAQRAGRGAGVEVDEELMRRIAEINEGQYFRASDEAALFDIYREIEHLERARVGVRKSADWADIYPLLLAPAVVLLVLELMLAATVFRRTP